MKLFSLFTAILLVLAFSSPARAVDIQKPEVKTFIDHMVEKYQYSRPRLDKLLSDTTISQKLIAAINHPAEDLPWYKYRTIFLRPARIKAGRTFVAEQKKALGAAQAKYGVPPAIIASLIGMESFYGRNEGSHSALQALVTLAFGYPRRGHFFRHELAQYLILCDENGFDPTQVKSSYAGALGAGQFMPSSYRHYGIDVDGHGSDLFHSWDDITASIANYLAQHGWRRGEPVAAPAGVPSNMDVDRLVGRTMKASQLRHMGVVFDAPVPGTAPVQLVKIELRNKTRYWVGLPNFSVLLSYNRSPLYALAATQLAAAIDTSAVPSAAAVSVAEKH